MASHFPKSESDLARSFVPYNLSPLDHLMPHMHIIPTFFFSLAGKDRPKVLESISHAIEALLSIFPFLTGMVSLSTQPEGRKKMFELRPATSDELKNPVLSIQNYSDDTPLRVNERFNPEFLPISVSFPPHDPSPVLRVKVNIVGNELIMVWCADHRSMDGGGVFTIIHIFGMLCCDPNRPPEELPTSPDTQVQLRNYIRDIGSSAQPQNLRWTLFSSPLDGAVSWESGRRPMNSTFMFDAEKISMLHDACNTALRSLLKQEGEDLTDISISPNWIVSALAGLCGSRARAQAFSGTHTKPDGLLLVAANIRKAAGLGRAYLGNSVAPIESKIDCDDTLPPLETLRNTPSLGPITPEDIWKICTSARTLQQELKRLDQQSVQGIIATVSKIPDWGSVQPGYGLNSNMVVSDVKAAPIYTSFGPLGDLQLFDFPSDTFPGVCWIMPDPPASAPGWRLRVIVEQEALGFLSKDPIFQWACSARPPRDVCKAEPTGILSSFRSRLINFGKRVIKHMK